MESGSEHSEGAFSAQGFFLQYTSLILIVLAMVIGALYRPDQTSAKEITTGLAPQHKEVGLLEFNDVFREGNAEVVGEQLLGVTEFSSLHDVDLDATVNVPQENSSAQRSLGNLRSVALFRYFERQGIPAESIKIFTQIGPVSPQVTIKIRKIPWEAK